MKVFVSSLIAGMEPFREAAREAIETARGIPVMAEDFGALPSTPQIACLTGLRESDVVVLILGERYGIEQPSGSSATHEEWRDAQDQKPVLVFVQEGVTREPRQAAFIQEVEAWAGGRFRAGFLTPRDLRIAVGRALIDYERANAVGPVNETEMTERALALLPPAHSGMSSANPTLNIAVAGGPKQQILRPAEIEDQRLWEEIERAALFGETQIFDRTKGVKPGLEGATLVLTEKGGGAQVRLEETGDLLIEASLARPLGNAGMTSLVDEEVQQTFAAGLALVAWVLDRIDDTEKLTHVAIAARITGGEYMPWLTRAELAVSNGSYSMAAGSADRVTVRMVKPRPALRLDKTRLIEDLLVPLRRQWKPSRRN